jgi:hypothetical protein
VFGFPGNLRKTSGDRELIAKDDRKWIEHDMLEFISDSDCDSDSDTRTPTLTRYSLMLA